jgi:hypothetical protein
VREGGQRSQQPLFNWCTMDLTLEPILWQFARPSQSISSAGANPNPPPSPSPNPLPDKTFTISAWSNLFPRLPKIDQPRTIFCLVPDKKYATEIVRNPVNRVHNISEDCDTVLFDVDEEGDPTIVRYGPPRQCVMVLSPNPYCHPTNATAFGLQNPLC